MDLIIELKNVHTVVIRVAAIYDEGRLACFQRGELNYMIAANLIRSNMRGRSDGLADEARRSRLNLETTLKTSVRIRCSLIQMTIT